MQTQPCKYSTLSSANRNYNTCRCQSGQPRKSREGVLAAGWCTAVLTCSSRTSTCCCTASRVSFRPSFSDCILSRSLLSLWKSSAYTLNCCFRASIWSMISGEGSGANVEDLDWAGTAEGILGSTTGGGGGGGGGNDIPEKLGCTSEILLMFAGFWCGWQPASTGPWSTQDEQTIKERKTYEENSDYIKDTSIYTNRQADRQTNMGEQTDRQRDIKPCSSAYCSLLTLHL